MSDGGADELRERRLYEWGHEGGFDSVGRIAKFVGAGNAGWYMYRMRWMQAVLAVVVY
jgi:hypothetical protein